MRENTRDTTAQKKGKIIIVDDEPHQRLILEEAIKNLGYDVTVCETGKQTLEKIRFGDFDVLLTDMEMPQMSGIRLLENVMLFDRGVSVILVTAHGTVETAVDAMKKGAEDYILKPVEFAALELTLKRVFERRRLVRENRRLLHEVDALKRDMGVRYRLSNTIGRSAESQKLLEEIQKHAAKREPLLILGETGVGKSDIARMVHYNSAWGKSDVVLFECGQVPADLHESYLFGQEETVDGGISFPSRPGLIEKAHLGTVIFTHIHRLNPKCHAGLSRVLREKKSQRTGGRKFYPADVRVIATSRKEEFQQAPGQEVLRWDLLDLLLENKLTVPTVRQRKEDIPLLVAAAAKRTAESLGKEVLKIERAVTEKLQAYDFPGNQRELDAWVESAVIRVPEGETTLKIEHFRFPG